MHRSTRIIIYATNTPPTPTARTAVTFQQFSIVLVRTLVRKDAANRRLESAADAAAATVGEVVDNEEVVEVVEVDPLAEALQVDHKVLEPVTKAAACISHYQCRNLK